MKPPRASAMMPPRKTSMERHAFILANTRVAVPLLCPEIRLRLITPACPLWSATEQDLAQLSLADPYWGFCWAGGQALARHVLDHAAGVAGRRVFVFGAGCGIDAVAAAKAGAQRVLACDIDPMAATATQINALLNSVSLVTTTADMIGSPLTGFDVVLAGDMFFDPSLAAQVFSWFDRLARDGLEILLGDPGRGNLGGQPLVKLFCCMAPADVDMDGSRLQETTVYAWQRDGRKL